MRTLSDSISFCGDLLQTCTQEIGTLVDPAAFDRTPRPGGSISLGVHRCVKGPWLSFDSPPRDAERRKQKREKQSKAKSAGALLRSKNGGGGGGEQRYLANAAYFRLSQRNQLRGVPPYTYTSYPLFGLIASVFSPHLH